MSPKEIIRAVVAAHNAHDVERMMSYFTEDSVMIDVASPIPLDSKNDVRKLYEMIFSSLDIHFEITGMIAEGNKVFVALRTTATGKGKLAGQDITGAKLDVFEGMFVETIDDQIKTTMFYSDTATCSKQLGNYSPALEMTSKTKNIM